MEIIALNYIKGKANKTRIIEYILSCCVECYWLSKIQEFRSEVRTAKDALRRYNSLEASVIMQHIQRRSAIRVGHVFFHNGHAQRYESRINQQCYTLAFYVALDTIFSSANHDPTKFEKQPLKPVFD